MASDIADLIARAERTTAQRLDAEDAAHSLRVAVEARRLADVYGVAPERAYLAGLLHDWAKGLSPGQLLDEAAARGIEVGDVEREVPYLLHSAVGASQAEEALDEIPSDVAAAIRKHTVGDAEMTPLDEVLFVADMTEPGRGFAGVERLRDLVGRISLQRLFLEAYASSISHVIRTRHHLHPQTVAGWNAAVDAVEKASR